MNMNRKIREQKGITMIYALFAMLIFMMLTGLAFNTAQINYTRYFSEKENDDISEDVRNVADLFMDMIVSDRITCDQYITNMSSPDAVYDPVRNWEYEDNGTQTPFSNDYQFNEILLNMAKNYYTYGSSSERVFKVSWNEETSVFVYMMMEQYDLTFLFAGEDEEHPNYITISIPALTDSGNSSGLVLDRISSVEYDANGNQISHCIYKISWEKSNVSVTNGNMMGVDIYEKIK